MDDVGGMGGNCTRSPIVMASKLSTAFPIVHTGKSDQSIDGWVGLNWEAEPLIGARNTPLAQSPTVSDDHAPRHNHRSDLTEVVRCRDHKVRELPAAQEFRSAASSRRHRATLPVARATATGIVST
jgi:hypothetical protein